MNKFFKTAFLTGLFVGTTDMISAFINSYVRSGKFASQMFNYIAAGMLGVEKALKGGTATAFLGLFFHYFIACAFTFFFFWIYPRIKFLAFNKYLIGMLYGVFVSTVVDQVILRFTPLGAFPFNLADYYLNWVIFGVIFGIPIVYNAYKYYGTGQS